MHTVNSNNSENNAQIFNNLKKKLGISTETRIFYDDNTYVDKDIPRLKTDGFIHGTDTF